MSKLLTLVTLYILSVSPAAFALSSCVAFDTSWNLLAFGFNGKDYNAGPQTSWSSGTATDITASGRPPFDGTNTTCYLSEFYNAIYVLGADTSSLSSIYIYDATAKSWSTQSVTTGNFDPSSFNAILDHDTNVFYALSHGELYFLNMNAQKAAQSSAISWTDVEQAELNSTGTYDPVMVIADNHVFFLDVPGVAAGSAKIFVIHFSFFQPEAQSFGNFPAAHGQATSFFLDTGVQVEFAFVPDDGSQTYIIDVISNTTQTAAGPPVVDASATYFASTTSLVQLTSSGQVNYFPYSPNSTSANSAAKWSTVQNLASVVPASSSSSSAGPSATKGSPSGTASKSGTATVSAPSGSSTSGSNNGSLSQHHSLVSGMWSALFFGGLALLLLS